jgi:signal transduction histidine kinase
MNNKPLDIFQRVRRSAWTLPAAVLAALVIFAINEAAYDRSTHALTNLGDRATARSQIQIVWRALIDAETGQRGYLLTGRKDYLQPYLRASGELQRALDWLRGYYSRDSEAGPVLADLARSSEGKLSELATTLTLHEKGASGAWRELVLTDIGRETMDSVRSASSRLLDIETQRIASERGDVFSTLRSGRIGVSAMTGMSLLALFLFLRQTVAFDRAQRRHADTLKQERDRLEAEAARRTADLTELARHLQTAREDERSRLARELHDELGALLTAAKLDAARLKRAIGVLTPDVQERLTHLNGSINRGIELKRRIIEDLRPSSLSNLGLVSALEILTRDHAGRSDVRLDSDLHPVPLNDSAQITVYRLVQEALTNIAKHAEAQTVTVTLREDDDSDPAGRRGARVIVSDDGLGFDPSVRRGSTHGLMGMRYRVEAEGGLMSVHAAPGAGTRIEAWLPRGPELPAPVQYDAEPLAPQAAPEHAAGPAP